MRRIRGLILDWDNTVRSDPPGMQEKWFTAYCKAARKYRPNLSTEELERGYIEGTKEHGMAIRFFSQAYGIKEEEFYADQIGFMDHDLATPCPLVHAFLKETAHVPKAILSSGFRDWVVSNMDRMGVKEYFRDAAILTFYEAGGGLKNRHKGPFEMAARVLDLPVESLAMVEDSPSNLVIAKELGMRTVLVTHGNNVDPAQHPYIDHQVSKVYDIGAVLGL